MVAPEFVLGQGKVSGLLALFFSILCLGAVLCFHFPEVLTSRELRAMYDVSLLRALLAFFLCVAFGLSLVSFVLSQKKITSLTAMSLVVIAVFFGGPAVPVPESIDPQASLGVDWFILDLLVLTLVFVPIERLFARIPEQRIFRFGWKVDFIHFFVSHLLVQLTTFLIMSPALFASRLFQRSDLHQVVSSQSLWLQVLEIIIIADFTQYWVHRLFHEIPRLWKFHEIHHSTVEMDWLAGSRLHLVDVVVTRGATLLPIFALGYGLEALKIYLVFVAVQATFIHANFRYELRALHQWIATPFYHHWHHASDAAAIDKNYAVHLPLFDRLFGTQYLPKGQWPKNYGVVGNGVREDYFAQVWEPFGWLFQKREPRS